MRRADLVPTLRNAIERDPTLLLVLLQGSQARGDARPNSDIDLIVDAADSDPDHLRGVAQQVQGAVGRPVQIIRLADARANAPTTLLDALNVGVAVLDRGQSLDLLRAEKPAIEDASAIELTELRQKA